MKPLCPSKLANRPDHAPGVESDGTTDIFIVGPAAYAGGAATANIATISINATAIRLGPSRPLRLSGSRLIPASAVPGTPDLANTSNSTHSRQVIPKSPKPHQRLTQRNKLLQFHG